MMKLSRYSFRGLAVACAMALSAFAAPVALSGCAASSATAIAGVNTQIGIGIAGLAAAESLAADLKIAGKISEAQKASVQAQATTIRTTLAALRASGGVDTANVLPATLTAITILQATVASWKTAP